MPGPFVNIEDKQDSAEQLAATQGIPSQFKYSAAEWNLLRDKIEQLHSILQGEIDLVATTIKNEFRLVDLSGTNANQYILSRVIHWLNNLEGEDKIVLKPNVVFTLEAYYAVGSYLIKESWQIKQEGNLEDKTFGVGEAPAPLSILLPIEKTIKLINQGNTVSLGEIGNPPNDQNGNPISAEEHISNEVNILLPNEPARQGFVFNALFNGVSRNFYFNGPNAAYGLNGSQTSSNQFYEFKETTNEEDVENVIEKTSQLINDGEDGASRFIEENELEDLETDPTVPQYIKDLTSENIENFATAFQENIINVVVTGDQNKQLTLTKRDGSTIVATFTDNQGEVVDNVVNSIDFNEANGVLSIQTEEGNTLTTSFDGRYALWSHNHEINEVNDLQNKLDNKLSYGDKGILDNSSLLIPNLPTEVEIVDLDTITNEGWYPKLIASDSNNNPQNIQGYLLVGGFGSSSSQIFYPYRKDQGNIAYRTKLNGTWTSWGLIPYQDELDNTVKKTGEISQNVKGDLVLSNFNNRGRLDLLNENPVISFNDIIGEIAFRGADGQLGNGDEGALIQAVAKSNWGVGSTQRTDLVFYTRSTEGGGLKEVMRINWQGFVSFSGNDPRSELDVVGKLTTQGTLEVSIAGDISYTSGSTTVTGTDTFFLTSVEVGDRLFVNNIRRTVVSIESDTSLTVDTPFNSSGTDFTPEKTRPIALFLKEDGSIGQIIQDNGYVGIDLPTPQEALDVNGNVKADKFITTDGNYTVETFKGDRNIGASPIIKGGIEIQGTFESVLTRLLMGIEENGEAYFKSNNHFTIEGKLLAQLLTEDFQLKITNSGYTFKEVGVGGHTVFKLDPDRFINIAEVTLPKNSGQLMALAPNAITSDNVPNVTYNEETGLLKEIDRPVSTFINTSNTGFSARNITYNVVNGRLILIGGATASADAVEVELLTLPTNARPDATRIVTNIFYELTINTNGVVTLANVADGQSYNIDFELTLNFL